MAYAKNWEERQQQFPQDWRRYRYAKTDHFNNTIKKCIDLYLAPDEFSLNSIADMVGLPDRRTVASYLSKAKQRIKQTNENTPKTGDKTIPV